MTAEAETGRLKGPDASRADDPEQLFDRALVSEAFARLHRSHREVVYRAYYLRWTTGQIAADLNVTEPVVKCRLHDALRTLRYALNDAAAICGRRRPLTTQRSDLVISTERTKPQ
jgi:DNA-directed RNA polymerase specialized sigma24 family protein